MKELIKNIKTGEFHHVYLLYGEESYLRLQYRDRLMNAILPDADAASMNLTVYKGKQTEEGALIDQAETLPFFADRRLIVVNGSGWFRSSTELLPDYLKHIPDYLYLIFCEEEADKRNRLYKAVRTNGYCAEFVPQTEETLSAWIVKMLSDAGLRIRRTDMNFLLSRTGTDMSHIYLETDKLINYCAGSSEVTRNDIIAVTTDRTENRIFDMVRSLTGHRLKDAMKMYADLVALRESPLGILFLIGREYSRLLIVKELSSAGAGQAEIAAKAGMPPFAVRRSLAIVRNYTAEQLLDAVSLCTGAEEDVKSGRMTDRVAVETVMAKLGASSSS